MEPEPTTEPAPPGMFDALTVADITNGATAWAGNFDQVLLVVVGLGVAFASVRFVKGLFF